VGGTARQRHTELEDALERLRLADNELQRARRNAARYEQEAKAAGVNAGALAERDGAIAARDERIARLESEKQDLIWRVAELEDRLTATIARAVRTDAARAVVGQPDARAQADVGPAALGESTGDGARERALDQFHKAATAHVGELTELKASVSEQSALVVELEDAVRTAEARAAASDADATALRRTAKDLEEADRSRRSRLAELEGKLLRFEHERRSAPPPVPPLADEERAAWSREREQLRAEIEKLAQHARGKNGHAAAAEKLDAMAAGVPAEPPPDAVTSRLENTLGNYRQRASRLRDELEGIRRRFDALSASEIAGFLEELGADLDELGK
jgi:chromosome segregation ATPase